MSIETSLAEKAATLKSKTKTKPKKVWRAPEVTDFKQGLVLAFDQTFSSTGWALVWCDGEGTIEVWAKGYLNETKRIPDVPAVDDVLMRTSNMGHRIKEVFIQVRTEEIRHNVARFVVVHEQPMLNGYRPESALLGAREVRRVAEEEQRPVTTVSNTRRITLLCEPDDRPNGKPAIKRALLRYLPVGEKGWNEHTRDALALALVYLHDKEG
jgi:hypothetical protein